MLVSIVESKYTSMYYDTEKKLFEQYWYPESTHMTEEEYKHIHLSWVQKLIKHRYEIYFFLLDNRKNSFVMPRELQKWHDEKITQVVIAHLPDPTKIKSAVVASEDFLSQLAIEQTVKENEEVNSFVYYFSDIREARDWIMRQKL
ncbi:hypothetical protein BKI52_01290 [marine bacterium AO1-C]|nr:hypothetical protein BKI52_01290 [marine bacterium AO1-C]